MSNIIGGLGDWIRRSLSPTQEAKLRARQQVRLAERKALVDKRELFNRTASNLENTIREKLARSKTMTGTALDSITADMNRLARELKNVRGTLIDNNNRLAVVEEELHKINLLMEGSKDMERAGELERLAIELEVQKDGAGAMGMGFTNVVKSGEVVDFTAEAGVKDSLAEFQSGMSQRPALDPSILEMEAEDRRRLNEPEAER